jgi:hypothetical protein
VPLDGLAPSALLSLTRRETNRTRQVRAAHRAAFRANDTSENTQSRVGGIANAVLTDADIYAALDPVVGATTDATTPTAEERRRRSHQV